MKKVKSLIAIIFVTSFFSSTLHGQSLGQDVEGFSTLVVPSFSIYLDGSNDMASLSIYEELRTKKLSQDELSETDIFRTEAWDLANISNIRQKLRLAWKANEEIYNSDPAQRSVWLGLDIKGSSSNGIAPIFSDDKLASSSSILGFVGYSWKTTHFNRKLKSGDDKYIDEYIKNTLKGGRESQGVILEKAIEKEINKLVISGQLRSDEKKYFSNIKNPRKKFDEDAIQSRIDAINQRIQAVPKYSQTITEIGKVEQRVAMLMELFEITLDAIKVKEKEKADKATELKAERNKPSGSQDVVKIEKLKREIQLLDQAINKMITTMRANHSLNRPWTPLDVRNAFANQFKQLELEIANISMTQFRNLLKFPTADNTDLKPWKAYEKLVKAEKANLTYISNLGNPGLAYDQLKKHYKDLLKITQRDPKEKKLQKRFTSKTLLYGRAGFLGSSFTLDLNNGAGNVADRFQSVDFQSYKAELGLTHHFKNRNYIGFGGGVSYNHNLSGLSEGTFTLQKADTTIVDGAFTASQEVKGFSGQYDRFVRWDLNFDYVRLVSLRESKDFEKRSHIYLSLNPYIRHRIYQNADVLKNHMIVGFGAHAFNSKDNKLMGGVFIQTEDLFGVHKDDEDVLNKGIRFGVIVKYSFKGLKPDKDSK